MNSYIRWLLSNGIFRWPIPLFLLPFRPGVGSGVSTADIYVSVIQGHSRRDLAVTLNKISMADRLSSEKSVTGSLDVNLCADLK